MTSNDTDRLYMRRALQLAALGEGHASPNPLVGAVIVADGKIIGEGFHRAFGGPHAEVNAVRSASDPSLFPQATIFVTLEPCSHYGKTPPCAELLIRCGFRRCVIGVQDPFAKVCGRGIAMLRNAGMEVTVGVLEQDCRHINRRFFTAHTLRRPYVTLKWAQSADGFIAATGADGKPCRTLISNPLSALRSQHLRADDDAIMVGTDTVLTDNPALTLRDWPGKQPLRVTFDRRGSIPPYATLRCGPETLFITSREPLADTLRRLYEERGITSLIVEGGARLLSSFIREGLADEARIEIAPISLRHGVEAPLCNGTIADISRAGDSIIIIKELKKH